MFKGLSKANSYIHVGMACIMGVGLVAFGSAWFWNKPAKTTHDSATRVESTITDKGTTKGDPSLQCFDLDGALDLNNDGNFDIDDLVLVQEIILGLRPGCDARGDMSQCDICQPDENGYSVCNPINGRTDLDPTCGRDLPGTDLTDAGITAHDIAGMMVRYMLGDITAEQYLVCSTYTPCENNECDDLNAYELEYYDLNSDGDFTEEEAVVFSNILVTGDVSGTICTQDASGNNICDLNCDGQYSVLDIVNIRDVANGTRTLESIPGFLSCRTFCEGNGFCGDGIYDIDGLDDILGTFDDEECDDGNTVSGDGCSAVCIQE